MTEHLTDVQKAGFKFVRELQRRFGEHCTLSDIEISEANEWDHDIAQVCEAYRAAVAPVGESFDERIDHALAQSRHWTDAASRLIKERDAAKPKPAMTYEGFFRRVRETRWNPTPDELRELLRTTETTGDE